MPHHTRRIDPISNGCWELPYLHLAHSAIEEGAHTSISAVVSQFSWIARGNDAAAGLVQHDAAVDDSEDAVELMGDHDHGEIQAPVHGQDELVELGGTHGVEPSRGLVQE